MTRVLHLDFETFSSTGLEKVGAHVYAQSPDFEVTVMAWAFDGDPVQSIVWPKTGTLPAGVEDHIRQGGKIAAHNAAFEYAVLFYHYAVIVLPEQLDCTMARALAWGLPAALGAAGRALRLATVKDEAEKKLMLSMGKPRPNGPLPHWHEADPARLARLEAYCRQDVEAERALDAALPPLSLFERKVSLIDAWSNMQGVMIDRSAVAGLASAAEKATTATNHECKALTGGAVGNPGTAVPAMKAWLEGEGFPLPDLKKETVEEALAFGTMPPDVRRVLELRRMSAKASLKKLDKMLKVSAVDGRARGLLQYYGAGRTGRWAGRLIQFQNLPRPKKDVDPAAVIRIAEEGKGLPAVLFDRPLDTIASCLRSCIVARPGHVLLSMDLSQIEARVTAWLAGQDDLVERFRRGDPVYEMAAASVGSQDRQLGKVMVLACQYGMGGPTFQVTARTQYGVVLTPEEAQAAVDTWRRENDHIKKMWWNMLEEAKLALGVIPQKGSLHTHGAPGGVRRVGKHVAMKVESYLGGKILKIRKPNGGVLVYHNPRVKADNYYFDGQFGENSTYGGKLVENMTQAVARDIMAEALVRIEEKVGLVPVMTIHDEAVYEIPETEKHLEVDSGTVQALFNEVPDWAAGLPIASEARTGRRYGK